jgi:hypothetical protein
VLRQSKIIRMHASGIRGPTVTHIIAGGNDNVCVSTGNTRCPTLTADGNFTKPERVTLWFARSLVVARARGGLLANFAAKWYLQTDLISATHVTHVTYIPLHGRFTEMSCMED